MRGVLRGAIPSCILHAALHCCLSMLVLQIMMPHRCYYASDGVLHSEYDTTLPCLLHVHAPLTHVHLRA